MGYGTYRSGGNIVIKDPKAPATDPQKDLIAKLMPGSGHEDERDVPEAQAAIIIAALEVGLLKGMASGYIGLLKEHDKKPSDEVLELRRQLAEARATAMAAATPA